jgi:selenide,water dikinase
LVLTKPIGSGVIATAIKHGAAAPGVVADAVRIMTTLNATAAETMLAAGVRGATDVTGFGLLGHLRTLLRASGVAARVRSRDVPMMPGARPLAAAGHVPGGTTRNLADLITHVKFGRDVEEVTRTLLVDAQTSGGLLMAVPPGAVPSVLAGLEGRAPAAAVIGEVVEGVAGTIRVD